MNSRQTVCPYVYLTNFVGLFVAAKVQSRHLSLKEVLPYKSLFISLLTDIFHRPFTSNSFRPPANQHLCSKANLSKYPILDSNPCMCVWSLLSKIQEKKFSNAGLRHICNMFLIPGIKPSPPQFPFSPLPLLSWRRALTLNLFERWKVVIWGTMLCSKSLCSSAQFSRKPYNCIIVTFLLAV